jgi:hypothetical protein
MPYYDEVIEILRATSDGDDLTEHDLRLTELAVNGRLNERGAEALRGLLANVRRGYVAEIPASITVP